MTENAVLKPEPVSLEAPASWNTRYLTPDGFVCQLTLRGETGKDLLERANAALVYLRTNGFLPVESYRGSSTTNPQSSDSPKKGEPSPDWCPIHNCQMKRWEKEGRVWHSHRTEQGWCRGKA